MSALSFALIPLLYTVTSGVCLSSAIRFIPLCLGVWGSVSAPLDGSDIR